MEACRVIGDGAQADAVAVGVGAALADDVSLGIAEHERAESLLKRVGGTILSFERLDRDEIESKFLSQLFLEHAHRVELRERLEATHFKNDRPISLRHGDSRDGELHDVVRRNVGHLGLA